MGEWQTISTAPKDGTPIKVKRVYLGSIIYEGPAVWRTVRFGELYDPISGEKFAEATDATGWMHPEGVADKRVPEPTHWMPLLSLP